MITAILPNGDRILFKVAVYIKVERDLALQMLYEDKACLIWVANLPLAWATINGNAVEQ